MTKRLLTSLLIFPALFATTSTTRAQCPAGENCGVAPVAAAPVSYVPPSYNLQPGPKHPHFPPFGCGGFCIGFLSRIHFHGPLYNYGPYTGYYPFEPYGPWTADLRYNGPRPGDGGGCGWRIGGGNGLGWGHYSVGTLKNVFHRVNPLANRCGSGLNLGKCGSHGSQCSTATCGTAGSSADAGVPISTEIAVQPTQPAPTIVTVPGKPVQIVPGVLTAQPK